jgi:SGNH domain (fused to AT3 domains)
MNLAKNCIHANDQVYELLKATNSIRYVVMSSPFGQYVNDGASVLVRDGRITMGHDIAFDYMKMTLKRIKSLGLEPVVFSPTPQNGQNIARCLSRAVFFEKQKNVCDFTLSDSEVVQAKVWEFLRKVEQVNKVVWLKDGICGDERCSGAVNDVLIYRDGGHLSAEGSAYVGKKMNFYKMLEVR